MTTDEFLRQAMPDCSTCGGTGIIEGDIDELITSDGVPFASVRHPDRVCHCVPILIIRAPDVP